MSVFILLVRISLHAHHRASSSPPLPRRRLFFFFFFFHLLPPNRYFRSIFGDVGGFRALDIE
jgi:hypothetical protein